MARGPANARTARSTSAARVAPTAEMPAAEAIPMLLERDGSRLYAVALRLCGHRDDAADLVQEVFLQAFRKWHTFRGDADPATWLHTIAARSCRTRWRRKGGVDRRMPAVSQLMPWGETTVTALAEAPDESTRAERNEAVARIQDEIARLPEHLRLPTILKEVLGLSVEQTAESLALAVNTVKTRLHRARLALRKAMTETAKTVEAPAPVFDRRVCLDLLKAKMDAMDRGGASAGFHVPKAEMCERCRAVFRELDLVQDACAQMADGSLPANVRTAILAAIAKDGATADAPARRGRRPVSRSARTTRR